MKKRNSILNLLPLLLLFAGIGAAIYFAVVVPGWQEEEKMATATAEAIEAAQLMAAAATETAEAQPSETATAAATNTVIPTEEATLPPTSIPTAVEITDTATSPPATATPSPTDTPSPPPTKTPTATHTPTTIFTPTPTQSPTVAPTLSPTPIPADAVVLASSGVTRYQKPKEEEGKIIDILPNGQGIDVFDQVEIEHQPGSPEKWFRVSRPGEGGDGGWVKHDGIQLNIVEDDITTIYGFGPRLRSPIEFLNVPPDEPTVYSWEMLAPLKSDQYYSIILVHDDLPDGEACFHWQTKDLQIDINPSNHNCSTGEYHWGVGVATQITGTIEAGNIGWHDDTAFDQRWAIGVGTPHRGGNPGDGEGGSDETFTIPGTGP